MLCVGTPLSTLGVAGLHGGRRGSSNTLCSPLPRSGVELAIRDPQLVNPDELETVVGKYNLDVPALGTGQAWGEERLSFTSDDPDVRRAAIERVKSHIPLAARFNAVVILGLIRGITPAGQTHEQSMGYLVEDLQECSTAAAPHGVRYALEPLNRYETDLIHTVADGLGLIERVRADNFGLLLDTLHMNVEEPSLEESIRACGVCPSPMPTPAHSEP